MPSENEKSSIFEMWKNGESLYSASHLFTDPFQLAKFHDAQDSGPRQAIQSLMFAELFTRIANGQLEAIGYEIEPNPKRELDVIPAHIFGERPIYEDCLEDVVKSRRWHFADIRVCEVSDSPTELPNDTSPAIRSGRPSTYWMSKEILDKLYVQESNRQKRASKLHADFSKAFLDRFPFDEWKVPAPSVRTLQNHINQYQQELAETGKK